MPVRPYLCAEAVKPRLEKNASDNADVSGMLKFILLQVRRITRILVLLLERDNTSSFEAEMFGDWDFNTIIKSKSQQRMRDCTINAKLMVTNINPACNYVLPQSISLSKRQMLLKIS